MRGPAWSCFADDDAADAVHDGKDAYIDSSKSLDTATDDDATSSSSTSQRSNRSRSLNLPLRAASRLFKRSRSGGNNNSNSNKRAHVPTISMTSLYNRLQTSSLVVIDCRSGSDFATGHIRGALHCGHGRRSRHKTVDDVLYNHTGNGTSTSGDTNAIARKLATRDMMEIVVIGSNRSSSSLLYKMDGGYRFAKLLLKEGRVFSVVFLAAGHNAFIHKYPFMAAATTSHPQRPPPSPSSSTPSSSSLPATTTDDKQQHLQYPNEIVSDFLFLGNFWQANDVQIVSDLQITHIINMGALTNDRNAFPHVAYLDVDIKDKECVEIRNEFAKTVSFIQQANKIKGARVLIHCVQGVSRSSTIVIWYLMLETKCTLSAAYSYVLKRRPLIFPNRGFMEQLMENEKEMYGFESVLPQELDLLQHGLLPPLDRKGSELRRSLY